MSEPVGATDQPGSVAQNAFAADGQVPGSSARIDSLSAHITQQRDLQQVCVFVSRARTDLTITLHIGLPCGQYGETDLGKGEDSLGEYCQTALKLSPCLSDT